MRHHFIVHENNGQIKVIK